MSPMTKADAGVEILHIFQKAPTYWENFIGSSASTKVRRVASEFTSSKAHKSYLLSTRELPSYTSKMLTR